MRARYCSSLLVAVSLSGCVMPNLPPRISSEQARKNQQVETGPFWWGVSTSGYQTEDKAYPPDDPRHWETDWDKYIQEGHAPERGGATYSWTYFDRDVALLRKLGVTHYRLGIEWARVEPRKGEYNEEAIARYVQMVRKLKAAGIEPVVTLWHFTFPAWLYNEKDRDSSNFLHPDCDERWRAYVTRMARELKPYVRYYVPQNEPNGMLPLAYLGGYWPPGLALNPFAYKAAMTAAVRQFREAAAIIREIRPDARILSVQALPNWQRSWLYDPTSFVYNTMMRVNFDHLDRVQDVCDLIGFNYYYTQNATLLDFFYQGRGEKARNYTQMGWSIDPEGFYEVIHRVWHRYRKPMVITENGIGTQNEQKKIKYLRDHINQMRLAMAEGCDVRGYFVWTLVDNYEWHQGYKANFGLAVMDPKTKQRNLEPAALWYAEFIRRNRNMRGDLGTAAYMP